MTLKMIIETDKHISHRGKRYNWLERHEMKNIDLPSLYAEHKVCKSW